MAIVGLTAFRSPAAHHSGQLASPLQSGLCAGPGQRNLELPCGEGGPSWPMAHRKGDQKAAEGGQACRNRRKPPRRLWTPQHPQTKPHPASWNLPWLSRARGLHLPAVVPGRARCRRVVKAGSTEGPLPTGASEAHAVSLGTAELTSCFRLKQKGIGLSKELHPEEPEL